MKNAVVQKDPLGCGIACVSFICGNSYNYSKKNYFRYSTLARIRGFICKDIVNALRISGREYFYRYIGNKRIRYKENTIVFIQRSKKYPSGHYLVYTAQGWMDSWLNFNLKNSYIKYAKSGFRKRLPGKAIYA